MIRPIITNIAELNKPCDLVTKEDNIKSIVQDLKDTLESKKGLGISANQIGIQKRISYIKVPKEIKKEGKAEYFEVVLINAKVEDKSTPIKIEKETCLSFPGITAITKRFMMCIVNCLDENLKDQTVALYGLESIVAQHEIQHQNSRTMFDSKWVRR